MNPKITALIASFLLFSLFITPADAALKKYIVEDDLDFDKFVIREYPLGDRYYIEKGIGCLSLWLYTFRPFYIDQSGFLDGISDKIILPDRDQSCRIWDAKLLSTSTPIGSLLSASYIAPTSTSVTYQAPKPKPNPLIPKLNSIFRSVFAHNPNPAEHGYWLSRLNNDKQTETSLKSTMQFYKAQGKTIGDSVAASTPKIAGTTTPTKNLGAQINAHFREVYSRNPSPSENRYWLSRIADKPSAQALKDAMVFHKAHGIAH